MWSNRPQMKRGSRAIQRNGRSEISASDCDMLHIDWY